MLLGRSAPGYSFCSAAERDTEAEAVWLAHKVANLRIFSDAEGKMNFSVKDIRGQVLVVTAHTAGEHPQRLSPSFAPAAAPDRAEPLVATFVAHVRGEGVPVQTGVSART